MKYTHVFFDLDHTLWDYDFNAKKVLLDMYIQFDLADRTNTSPEGFQKLFFKTNAMLWHQFNFGKINRDDIRNDRFRLILNQCKGDVSDANGLSDYFLHHCPRQTKIMEGTHEALLYLSEKYKLYIITNGFDDVQWVKLKSSGLGKYFHDMFTSETIGFRKPSPEIFEFAMSETKATPELSVMIGDNPITDIQGANKAGIFTILFDPHGKVQADSRAKVAHFDELKGLL